MNTGRRLLLAATVVLLAGFFAGAMAQRRQSTTSMPPIADFVSVDAVEITDGKIGFDEFKRETAFGYSFIGKTSGYLPGSFMLSMNCTPAIPVAGEVSEMTGGSWALPVYISSTKGDGYTGSLYGTITKGSMLWDKAATTAVVYFDLSVDGGTGDWLGKKGFATFSGTLVHDEKAGTTLKGTLFFTLN